MNEVTLEKEKNSLAYRHRLRDGMSRFQDIILRRGVNCAWWVDLVLVNQLLVDLVNEMHENKIVVCDARHTQMWLCKPHTEIQRLPWSGHGID